MFRFSKPKEAPTRHEVEEAQELYDKDPEGLVFFRKLQSMEPPYTLKRHFGFFFGGNSSIMYQDTRIHTMQDLSAKATVLIANGAYREGMLHQWNETRTKVDELISTLKKTAKNLKDDTLVSMAEGMANEIIAKTIEEVIIQEIKKLRS